MCANIDLRRYDSMLVVDAITAGIGAIVVERAAEENPTLCINLHKTAMQTWEISPIATTQPA